MANNLVSAFSKNAFQIKDQTLGVEAANGLKVIKVVIRLQAEPQRHLMENGSSQADTRTIRPIKIQADVIVPDVATLVQVNAIVNDRKSLYQISTRGLVIPDMMIDSELMSQTAENVSSTVAKLSFKQVVTEGNSQIFLANSADSSLIDRGISLVGSVTKTAQELFAKASNAVSDLIG